MGGQSGHGTLKLTQKVTDEKTDFLHAGTNSGKLKVDSMIFAWAWSLIYETLKSAYLKYELMN